MHFPASIGPARPAAQWNASCYVGLSVPLAQSCPKRDRGVEADIAACEFEHAAVPLPQRSVLARSVLARSVSARSVSARFLRRRGCLSGEAGGSLRVEIRPLAEAGAVEAEWAGLASRALERNVFVEPAFALAAVQHLAEARDVNGDVLANRLKLRRLRRVPRRVLPLTWRACRCCRASSGAGGRRCRGLARWSTTDAPGRHRALLAFLAERRPRGAAMLFPMVAAEGPFARVQAPSAAGSCSTVSMVTGGRC